MIYRLIDVHGRVLGDFDEANGVRNNRNNQFGKVTELNKVSEPDEPTVTPKQLGGGR